MKVLQCNQPLIQSIDNSSGLTLETGFGPAATTFINDIIIIVAWLHRKRIGSKLLITFSVKDNFVATKEFCQSKVLSFNHSCSAILKSLIKLLVCLDCNNLNKSQFDCSACQGQANNFSKDQTNCKFSFARGQSPYKDMVRVYSQPGQKIQTSVEQIFSGFQEV